MDEGEHFSSSFMNQEVLSPHGFTGHFLHCKQSEEKNNTGDQAKHLLLYKNRVYQVENDQIVLSDLIPLI